MNHQDGAVTLTRQELYDAVWTTAMRTLAPQLGVSDVGLRKICKRFDIPTPPVGYWAKKQHGKAPRRPKLRDYEGADNVKINFYPHCEEKRTEYTAEVAALIAREEQDDYRITVPEALCDPHPLVAATIEALEKAVVREHGLIRPQAKRTLHVHVAPENVDRAIRIFDSLLKALEARSLPVQLKRVNGAWATTVTILGETIGFGLYQKTRREEREPTISESKRLYQPDAYFHRVPEQRLCLAVMSGPTDGRRRCFTDTARRPVENLLNAFVACLFRTSEDIKVERKRQEVLERQREEDERRRREHEILRIKKLDEIREEEARVVALMKELDGWSKAQTLRQYIEAVRTHEFTTRGEITAGSKNERWIRWALQQADRLDPLTDSPPSVLDEKAKWDYPSYWYGRT